MAHIVLLVPLGEMGAGHPGNALPGLGLPGGLPGDPGYDRPIHHPGHPDHGLPSRPAHIGNQLPWSPGSPDNSLPVPPGISPPYVPPDLASQVIVLWKLPNQTEWHGKTMDPSLSPDQGLPPAPEPKY